MGFRSAILGPKELFSVLATHYIMGLVKYNPAFTKYNPSSNTYNFTTTWLG